MNVGHYDKHQARAYDLKARLIQLWRHTIDVDTVIKEIAIQIQEAVDDDRIQRPKKEPNAINQMEPNQKTD